jgi:hypothetical protein
MASQNEHTGARLVSKPLSKDGQDNWDRIFGKRIKEQKLTTEDMLPEYELNKSTGDVQSVSRIDVIGQNGNDGDHY